MFIYLRQGELMLDFVVIRRQIIDSYPVKDANFF